MTGQLALNTSCLATFGELVIFDLQSPVTLTGIFGTDSQKNEMGGAAFNDAHHALELLKSDIDTHNIAIRDAVIVRGDTYQIIEISEDTGGMAKLVLRRY